MRVIKLVFLLFLIILGIQCKKTENTSSEVPISSVHNEIIEGHYVLTCRSGFSVLYNIYYIKNDLFYNNSHYTDSNYCFNRIAGIAFKKNDTLQIPYLHIGAENYGNTCVFLNDKYGGDEGIVHLSEIRVDPTQSGRFIGRYSLNIFGNIEYGNFSLGRSK